MDRVSVPIGYRVARGLLSRPLHRAYDIDVEGDARLPDGPVVLVANHRSFMDSIFLALVVDRAVSFLAKAEYFDRRRTAWLFRSTGQIPLRRGNPAGARRAIDDALGVLDRGGVIGVYPEGTRSRDGMLHRGNLGPARLAAAAHRPAPRRRPPARAGSLPGPCWPGVSGSWSCSDEAGWARSTAPTT